MTQLQISEENGKRFIVPIVYSLAESKFVEHLIPLAIYKNAKLVGFTMYGKDPEDQNYWIYVFMIDKRYQRQGYGKAAMIQLIGHIRHEHRCEKIMIGHKPDNEIAGRLYESVGFQDTGKMINHEMIKEYLF